MDEASFGAWLDAYGRAWETRDPTAAAELFADDARYWESPFDEPAVGREGVRAYWEAAATQEEIRFRHDVLAVVGDSGFAHWSVTYRRPESGQRFELDGMFLIDFDGQGLARSLREWWLRRELD